MPKERYRFRRDLNFTLQAHPWLVAAYNNPNKQTNKQKQSPADPEEGGESDFQSDHIISFTCPVFNEKSQNI